MASALSVEFVVASHLLQKLIGEAVLLYQQFI